MQVSVLIVAAGRGRRFGDPLPKQYLPVAGVCSLRRCLNLFLSMANIAAVQVVIHPDDRRMYDAAIAGLDDPRLHAAVPGGETRAASVACGLLALVPFDPNYVLVHDAARPFVTRQIVNDIIDTLGQSQAAFAALPVVDALWRVEDGAAQIPVPRDGLWRAQTPQGFHFAPLLAAHQGYQGDAADDVEIARAMGMSVKVVMGSSENFKITAPADLERAEDIVAKSA